MHMSIGYLEPLVSYKTIAFLPLTTWLLKHAFTSHKQPLPNYTH